MWKNSKKKIAGIDETISQELNDDSSIKKLKDFKAPDTMAELPKPTKLKKPHRFTKLL